MNFFDGRNIRDRPPPSRGTEFSYIHSQANRGGGFGGGGSSTGLGGFTSEFSNIDSRKYGPSFTPMSEEYYSSMRPGSRQSSGVMGYSQGYDSATDGAGDRTTSRTQDLVAAFCRWKL